MFFVQCPWLCADCRGAAVTGAMSSSMGFLGSEPAYGFTVEGSCTTGSCSFCTSREQRVLWPILLALELFHVSRLQGSMVNKIKCKSAEVNYAYSNTWWFSLYFPFFLFDSSVHGEKNSMLLTQVRYLMVFALKSECQLCKIDFDTHVVPL